MKKTVLFSLLLGALGTAVSSVTAVEVANRETDAVVKFKASTDKNDVVDPNDGENNVTPIDPIDPEKEVEAGSNGPLSLDYASSLNFGANVISSKDQTYFASAQEVKLADGSTAVRPLFAQVTDNRGTLAGWKLTAKQEQQLTSVKDKQELVAAQISFANASIFSARQGKTPSTVAQQVVFKPGESNVIATAAEGEGAGTWSYLFGSNDSLADVEGRKVLQDVKLFVPGSSVKLSDEYRSTITWSLMDTPN